MQQVRQLVHEGGGRAVLLRERVEQLSVAAVASPSPPRGALDWNARFEGMKDELLQTVAKAVRDRDATPAAGAPADWGTLDWAATDWAATEWARRGLS